MSRSFIPIRKKHTASKFLFDERAEELVYFAPMFRAGMKVDLSSEKRLGLGKA